MHDAVHSNTQELESLRRLCAKATHNASEVMSRWTDSHIQLSLDEAYEVPLESVCAELGIGDDPLTMVVVNAVGEFGAELILMFDENCGGNLAACLLNREPDFSPDWVEMEKSALNETGNILACAYLNAVSKLVDCKLLPSAPLLIRDYGASVLQQALMVQAVEWNKVLICRTLFRQNDKKLNWQVLFIPNDALRKRIDNACLSYN